MGLKQLHKGTEDQRRLKIIQVSKSRDSRYLPQLLSRLESDETYANKRHIVRALGNIGGSKAEQALLELLRKEKGLILGDICGALASIGSKRLIPEIKMLRKHENAWVRGQAAQALRAAGVIIEKYPDSFEPL